MIQQIFIYHNRPLPYIFIKMLINALVAYSLVFLFHVLFFDLYSSFSMFFAKAVVFFVLLLIGRELIYLYGFFRLFEKLISEMLSVSNLRRTFMNIHSVLSGGQKCERLKLYDNSLKYQWSFI